MKLSTIILLSFLVLAPTTKPLPDLSIVKSDSPYAMSNPQVEGGFCGVMGMDLDTNHVFYSCPIQNTGNAVFWTRRNVQLSNFLVIKVFKVSDTSGWSYKYYKTDYDFLSECLDPANICDACAENDTMMCIGINCFDMYYNDFVINGVGSYVAMVQVNIDKTYSELSYKNNDAEAGFIVNKDPLGIFHVTRSDFLLTPFWVNKLRRL